MSVSLIAAIGKNRELGAKGQLLWHSKTDMEFFRKTTLGHPILMGRKTFESLPKLLPGRIHYVLTREARPEFFEKYHLEADAPVKLVHDLTEFLDDYHEEDEDELFVIGGGLVYQQALSECDKLYLTEIDKVFPEADTFFPVFDVDNYEREELISGSEDGVKFTISVYNRKESV